jgi:phosphoenolpyruvate phosphomutase
VIGSHNALTAKLGEQAGFDGLWASGFEISTIHGVPDANILTMTEFLQAAEEMSRVVQIPVIADCDTGFGNSNNVAHMVRKYEAAGIAAVSIEDKKFPKVNSFIPGRQELAPIGEFVGKIMAAKSAQKDPDFMIIARVEALISGWGLEEALRRANTYAEAGADAILMHSKAKTADELAAFFKAWDRSIPVVVVPTTYYASTGRELAAMGAKVVIYANQGLRAATTAIQSTFRDILEADGTATVEGTIAPMAELFELQGMTEMKRQEKIFLRSDDERVVAIIAAAGVHKVDPSMRAIAETIPISALDLSGKTLLERQAEALRTAGVKKHTVVLGYLADHVKTEGTGVEVAINEDWETTGNLQSIFRVLPSVKEGALVVYGDILFEPEMVTRLLRGPGPITLLVDRSFGSGRKREPGKRELVQFAGDPGEGHRVLTLNRYPAIRKIGKSLDLDASHGEFAGLAYLNPEGVQLSRKFFGEAEDNGAGPARGIRKAGLVDFLQYMIDEGVTVTAAETTSGWTELHSLDDYRHACAQLLAEQR